MIHITPIGSDLKAGINLEPGKGYTRSIVLMIPTPFKTIGHSFRYNTATVQRYCIIIGLAFFTKDIRRVAE